MEQEIQVRKKRFVAFWAVVLLVCSLMAPMAVRAAEVSEIGQMIAAGSEISVESVTYYNQDGTENQSAYPESSGMITISGYADLFADIPAGQTFQHWAVTEIYESSGVVAGVTLKPVFAASRHTIQFVNEDGTQLQSSEIAYGEMPAYNGETPTKAATAEHSYIFAGWSPALTTVTGDATYQATFTESTNRYTIRFVNEDGTQLQSSEVTYGETPIYEGTTPAKAATAQYTYTFAGWTPEIVAVTGSTTYTATYTETANQYTIRFMNDDGSEISSIMLAFGAAVTPPEDPTKDDFVFAGWDKEIPAAMPAENVTITAKWTPYVIDAGTYDMKQDKEYKLGSATKVSGDNSTYASGSIFYVPADGSYTFS